jgi:hypothetical protein
MLSGILFSVVVSLAISGLSLTVFIKGRAINAKFIGWGPRAFALFWLMMAMVWFFIAFSDFFAYRNVLTLSIVGIYTLQTFVGASLVFALYFLRKSLAPLRNAGIFLVPYVFLYGVFLYTLFTYPLHQRRGDFFANQITSSNQTLLLYVVMFTPLFIWSWQLLLRTVLQKKITDAFLDRFYLFASLSLIVLGVAGSLDEIGVVFGWIMTISRLVTLVGAIFAFVAISALQEPDELVI